MRGALVLAAGLVLAPVGQASNDAPRLDGLRVTNGSTPFAGDRALLTTVSPNGDGFRDRAIVSFRLSEPAVLRVEAVSTSTVRAGRTATTAVWSRRLRLPAGPGRIVWRPSRRTPPRTYILRLTTTAGNGRTRTYGGYPPGGVQNAPVVRVQGIDAGFTRRSYAPGQNAELSLATDASSLRLQVFAYLRAGRPSEQDVRTSGVAMTAPIRVEWTHRDAAAPLRVVRAGDWPSGLYFLRALAADGRVGYAPLIVRPRQLGTNRVAVVLATNTWQAYNFEDADGDGWGDSWYVSGRVRRVNLERPFLDFGVPFRFKDWDTTFVAWLNRTGKQVDFLSDDDVARVRTGDELARAYDLIVFPGHEEYVTSHEYDVVRRYRDLGGNLMFLAANNFYWRVAREGRFIRRVRTWRTLGRPEANLVGVQYVGSNHGEHQAGFVVGDATAAPWAWDGTGLDDGMTFGRYGIEIDARAPSSPPGTQVLATIPQLLRNGRSAEMTYYETPRGAKVFAAGAINFAASLGQPEVSRLVDNVWARLSVP